MAEQGPRNTAENIQARTALTGENTFNAPVYFNVPVEAAQRLPTTNFFAAGRSYNRTFVGRTEELQKLHEVLTEGRSNATPLPAAVTQGYTGEGGIGKSELAQRYAEQHAGDWDARWWLDCSNRGHRASLTLLARELGLTLVPESAVANDPTGELTRRAWMKATRVEIARALRDGRRHLLILDNLEPSDNPNAPWDTAAELVLPARCAVLITTREQRVPHWLASVVRLGVLSVEDARALLLKRFGDKPPAWPADDLDALAAHLARHALAVDLAAAWLYINPGLTPTKLLSEIRSSDEAMLALFENDEIKDEAHNYRVGVASTLALHMDSPELAAAMPLLEAAAFVGPDRIPISLLAAVAGLDQAAAGAAVRALVSRSILSHESDAQGELVALHRLTQVVVRARVRQRGEAQVEAVLQALLDALIDIFGYPASLQEQLTDHARTPQRLAAWSHADLVLARADGALAATALGPKAARLHSEVGWWLAHIGQFASALQHINKAIDSAQRQVPINVRNLAVWRATRARIRRAQGELAGALDDVTFAIDWAQRQRPVEERNIAICCATRANIRHNQGDLSGALGDITFAIDWGLRQVPVDEQSVMTWRTNRAGIRLPQGDLPGALDDITRAIDWTQRQVPLDMRTMAVRRALRADIRRARRELPSALDDITFAIDFAQRQMPVDERSVAVRRTIRAGILWSQGDLSGALDDITFAIGWTQRQVPVDETSLAIRRGDRAGIRQAQGDLLGALDDVSFATEWHLRQVPVNEGRLAFLYETKAILLARMDRYPEARAMIDECVRLRTRVFGADHEWMAVTVRRQQTIHAGRVPG
jgi:tetratricopeptide (TPR) repeat protein